MEIAEQARGVLNEIEYLLAEPDEASSQASQGSRQTLTETEQQEQHQSVLEHQSIHNEQINQHFNQQHYQQVDPQFNQQHYQQVDPQFNQQPYQQVNQQFNQQTYQQVNPQVNQQQFQQVNQEFNQQQVSRFQPDIRLPELRLDPFNGDPRKWPTFWQLFSANIDQRPMDNIRKMSYLLTFLQGPAKELVAGFVLSNENYTRALDLLKSRYGDSRAITEALEAELMNLHPANESTYSLRGFVDNIERICRQLEAYGHVDSSPFVSTAIKSKLPQQIVAKLVEKERGSGIRWNCAQLRKELREIVEIKEEVQRCSTVTRVRQEITNPPVQRNKVAQKGRPPELTRSFGAPIQSRQENRRLFRGPRRCSLCDIVGHLPSQCPKYPTPQDRFRRLRAQNRCVRCLNEGHTSRDCHSFKICGQCQGGHHMLVCTKGREDKGPQANYRQVNKQKPQKQFTQMAATSEKGPATGSNLTEPSIDNEKVQPEKSITAMAYSHLRKKPTAYLMTRKIAIASPREPNKEIPAFVFFDPGSQLSYIVKSLVKKLRPPQIARDDVEVHGFGGTLRDPIRIRSPSYAISIQREDGEWEEVELNWTKEISTSFEMANWVAEMPTQVADFPEVQKAIELSTEVPGIMLGTRHFWKYFMGRTEVAPGLFVIQTAFGPVVGGESDMSPQGGKLSHSLATVSNDSVDQMPQSNTIEEFWNLESIGIRENPASDDDQVAINQLKKSITQDKEGRYTVSWLWREPRAPLPSNYRMAYSRLCSTYNNLNRSKELLEKYNKVFLDYLKQGIIEPAQKDPEGQEHYLAHHAVITHKLRPVFDASAHPRGQPSLNDCLLRGPVLLPEFVGLLIRFRQPKYVAISDIESAFLMVGLHPADREVAKFLWVKELQKPPVGENIQVYRFARVAFGVICSPYLLAGVIRHHLDKYGPGVASELANSLYVDNLHLGAETWPELLDKCRRAKEIFSDASMNLREFSSNSSKLMNAIPEKDRLDAQEPKVLGMRWNINTDSLSFQLPNEPMKKNVSRRAVLSSLAGIYDPLGLLSPSVLPAKLFFQKLWDEGHDWDSPLSDEETSVWEKFLKGWQHTNISLPRRALSITPQETEIHTFVDASSCAYAAAVYLRGVNNDSISTSLIFAKNRLKPKKGGKTLTIPRMELIAILIGVRATAYVKKEIGVPLTQIHLWSDSQIALSWVRSPQSQPSFVQRRLDEIKRHTNITFHYIRTNENPSDLATRGLTPQELNQSRLWWSGPDWLEESASSWPEDPNFETFNLKEAIGSEPEENHSDQVLTLQAQVTSRESHQRLIRSSSWVKSRRIMFYILRFINVILGIKGAPTIGLKSVSKNGPPTASDITLAEKYLIKWEQNECSEELLKYKHIIDKDKIIRLQTRMINSQSPEGLIHPILLPKNSVVGKLVITHIHKGLCHAGVDWTLTEYLNQYWQPKARQTVRRVISDCMACRKMNSYKYALPEMPPLPSDRVQQRRPFQSIGIDYAGPTLTKVNGALVKCWLVLITCLTTRAVYIEPTLDLTAASFINVFRRFISRRGKPERVLTDNGRNLVLAEKAISAALAPLLADSKIEWKFIPALSPWAGGIYERLIGLAKTCFRRTLGKQILPYDQLATFVAEVEAALNSRPLTHVSDGEGTPLPLRPIDFIQPGSILNFDPANKPKRHEHLQPHEQLLLHWKGTLENLDSLWTRWRKEYLVLLRDNSKWNHAGPRLQTKSSPEVGDVVLVEDSMQPRNTWIMARVEQLNGQPGPIRSVKLRMPNGRITTRPVNRIYPLEAGPESNDKENIQPDDSAGSETEPPDPGIKITKKISPFEEEAEEDPPPPTPIPTNLRQGRNIDIPSTTPKHRMITRSKATVMAAALFVLCFSSILFSTISAVSIIECTGCPSCRGCLVHCNNRGVRIFAPEKISKIQICCAEHCHLFPGQPEFNHILPKEMLVNNYECKANFWDTNRENPYEVSAQCSAFHPCQLIDCNFCLELLLNSRCKPKMAAIVACSVLFPILLLLSCLFGAIQKFIKPFGFLFKILRKAFRRQRERAKTIKRKLIIKEPIRKLTRNIKEVKKKGRELRQASLMRLARYGIFSLFLASNLSLANSDTVAVISQSESCRVNNGTRFCSVTSSTTLSLLPAGQPNTLLIKNKVGEVLGALTLTLKALTLVCNPKTIAYLRSYQINTRSVWRCPTSGSCSGSFCSQVGPNTHIPELVEIMDKVGTSGCLEPSAMWSKGCGLPTASCHFYRWYAVPMSLDVYELFECPTWDYHIKADLAITVNDNVLEEFLTLIPGLTHHGTNISLTPIAVSNPPAPILGTSFLTHGFSVALGKDVPRDLKCPDLPSARGFGCSISEEACRDCRHANDTVTCQCREFDAEAILADPEARLPLNIGRHTFLTDGEQVYVEQTYTPIQIHLQMKNFQLISEITESSCKITAKNVRGCYKCLKGVQVNFTCTTDFGTALAYTRCADGINFVTRCSKNGTEGIAAFTYTRSRIDTICTTKCPGGDSEFNLKGELMFIPLPWKEREIVQSMSGQKTSVWNLSNFSPYSLFPALPIGFIISLLFVLISLLILFYFFLRLKLKFFRKIATQLVPIFIAIFLAGGEGAICPLNKTSAKLQIKIWQIQKNNCVQIKHLKMFFCPTSAQITHFTSLFEKLAKAKNKANFCNSKDALWRIIQQAPVRHIKSNKQKEVKMNNCLLHINFTHRNTQMAIFFFNSLKDELFIGMPKIGGARRRKKARPLGQNFLIAPPNIQPKKFGFINSQQSQEKSFSTWQFIQNSQATFPSIATLNLFLFQEMQAQPCLVPPEYEPGSTYREYFLKCQEVGYTPDWPRRGQTMAEYIPKSVGRFWPPTWTNDTPRRRAQGLLLLLWENLTYKGKRLPQADPILSPPAWITDVQPGQTVEDFFRDKGQPLEYPELPCLVLKGGVRGSSRQSRQRVRAVGHSCWKAGQLHEEYLPLELLIYTPVEYPEPRIGHSATGRNIRPSSRVGSSSTTQPPPARNPREPEVIREEGNEEALKIIIPRAWRPIKSISIIFAIIALAFALGADTVPAQEFNGFLLCPFFRAPCCFLPFVNNNYLLISSMPKRSSSATVKEQRIIKKARESAFIATFGKPQSIEDQEEMDRLVNSMEEIPRPDNNTKFIESNKDSQSPKTALIVNPEEDFSASILPLTTQIENENKQQQQQQNQPPPIPLTTSTQPPLQYKLATALAPTQSSQMEGQVTIGSGGGISENPENPPKSIYTDCSLEERISNALLTCISKLTEKAVAIPPPASTSQIYGAPTSMPSVKQPTAFPPPEVKGAIPRPIPLSRVGETDHGEVGPRGDPRRPTPYAREAAGGRPVRPALGRSPLVDQHLRTLRIQAEQLNRSVGRALADLEQEKLEEPIHDFLAIEGGITRVLKSIRTTISRLPPR
ncbi:unnamed protein product [Meloidogyne enterolobii]|uniref:Uncharacterized protein n=1 Tax=Meloidogyne enterolobii TaxID=390850 RepID=A0ACB0Y7C6_MELEN